MSNISLANRLTIDEFEAYFRTLTPEEAYRWEYVVHLVYDVLEQEGINRGLDIGKMIDDGDLLLSVLNGEIAGVISAFLVQPTDISSVESEDGYNLVYAPTLRVIDRVLARLNIRKQVWYSE